jgi:hypothetical protein
VWKKIGILIGFKEWDIEAWSGVSGFGYVDIECKQKKNERKVKFYKTKERKGMKYWGNWEEWKRGILID